MNRSLFTKFILTYVLFALLSFLAVSTVVSQNVLASLIDDSAAELYREVYYISSDLSSSYNSTTISSSAVDNEFDALGHYENTTIWLIDTKGIIQVSSDPSMVQLEIEEFDPAYMGNQTYSIGTFYDTFPEKQLTVMAPVTYGFKTYGYVMIHMPYSELAAERDRELNQVYLSMLIIICLSLILLLLFAVAVYYPVRKITQAAREYADGNYGYTIELDTEDEIGQLADTMNYMGRKLAESDEYQKKFISDISHDFRSPLTSIKGYLEAIQDGTIPPEMQDRYIGILIRETERLTKLTNGLLTLNTLDTQKSLLDITTFDINSVIRDTVSSFEGRCIERQISVDLLFHHKKQPVKADITKIQQVIYNLLDNAIKFSSDRSSIKIETTARFEKVFISIKDSGIGIPKESQKKIWERFYKTDLSRGKDKKGTGLGLSIVKEIITAHGENINCISTEGVGTEFIFTLPRLAEDEE